MQQLQGRVFDRAHAIQLIKFIIFTVFKQVSLSGVHKHGKCSTEPN